MLPLAIASQRLQVVAWKYAEVVESLGRVYLRQLTLSDPSDALESTCRVPLEQGLGVPVPKGPDHQLTL